MKLTPLVFASTRFIAIALHKEIILTRTRQVSVEHKVIMWNVMFSGLMLGEEKKNICGLCGKRYKHRTHLNRHVKYECNIPPQFACPVCPYKAKQKGVLTRHFILRHSNM